jgi:uncharacterized protein (UPF0264 family)
MTVASKKPKPKPKSAPAKKIVPKAKTIKPPAVPERPAKLLVSVRNAEEAVEALKAGADLIDVKEPSKGPLGMAEAEVVAAVVKAVGGKVPVSAAFGEWSDHLLTDAVWHLELPLTYVKWGLSGYPHDPGWGEDLLDARRQLPTKIEAVAVAYADAKRAKSIDPAEIAKFAKRYRYKAFLLDTFLKDGKTLFDFLKPAEIAAIFASLKVSGVQVALGGSLKFEQIPLLRTLGADYVAVRGAVCSNGRNGLLDPVRVKKWKQALAAK